MSATAALRVVRAAAVAVVRIVERPHAGFAARIGNANGRNAVAHRNAVRAGKRSEVGIERAVLLHDDDDVPNLVNRIAALRADRQRRQRKQNRKS